MSQDKKVRNWKEYNASLVKRGEIILKLDDLYLKNLYYSGKQIYGGKRKYSKEMFEFMLTIKVIMKFTWRTTQGFVRSLLRNLYPNDEVMAPNYAHANRECKRLDLKIRSNINNDEPIELCFDSTGIRIYNTSEWHLRKHGKKREKDIVTSNDRWKKVHLAVDLKTGQILDCAITDSTTNDCQVVKEMANEVKQFNVEYIIGDGAYDASDVYEVAEELGAQPIIPPKITAKAQDELSSKKAQRKTYLVARDDIIKEIRKHKDFATGRDLWKISSGYHRRSKIEATMHRLKRTHGFTFQHKNDNMRMNEMVVKINFLNDSFACGKAVYTS